MIAIWKKDLSSLKSGHFLINTSKRATEKKNPRKRLSFKSCQNRYHFKVLLLLPQSFSHLLGFFQKSLPQALASLKENCWRKIRLWCSHPHCGPCITSLL